MQQPPYPPPPPYIPAPPQPQRRRGLLGFVAGAVTVAALAGGVATYSAYAGDSSTATFAQTAPAPTAGGSTTEVEAKFESVLECLRGKGITMSNAGSIDHDKLKAAAEECLPEDSLLDALNGMQLGFGLKLDGRDIKIPEELEAKVEELEKCLRDGGIDVENFEPTTRADIDRVLAAAEKCLPKAIDFSFCFRADSATPLGECKPR